ncbi:MAG: lytic transglycosylase [Rickettsiales bacterium]|nr:MAG: lytic transglycosylase [Rickettsiales bacterium]
MRILSLLSIILMICLNCNLSFAKENSKSKLFKLMKQHKWEKSYKLASKIGDPALGKIVLSQQYLDNKYKKNSFEDIAKFLRANPRWPQNYLLRLRLEGRIEENTDKKLLANWFKRNRPLTGRGYKYHALTASFYEKNPDKLSTIIKNGWRYGSFKAEGQREYYKKFKKHLTENDHVRKIDNDLWEGNVSAAKRSLHLVSPGYKKSFNAQIAFVQKKKKAERFFRRVSAKYYTPGLVYRYLSSKKTKPPSASKIDKLIKMVKSDKRYAGRFWALQSYLARESLEKKRYRDAYKIASGHFTVNAGNRSDAEFLSGWIALSFLKNSKLALKHFRNFNRVVKTPISKSRGIYWLGRAHEKGRDIEKAQRLYNLAADKYPYTFYGQIAMVELKRAKMHLPPAINLEKYKKSSLAYLKNHEIARATQIVTMYGSNSLSEKYIDAAVSGCKNTAEVMNMVTALKKAKNIHYMVWAAKAAVRKHVFIKNHAYPTPYKVSKFPLETPLIYSIIRQESVFDKRAISSAKAMGLMQLIEPTACMTARSIKIRCRISKLTTDINYNMRLGSNYLGQLVKQYSGSYVLAMAAYNAGPPKLNKRLKIYGDPRKMKTLRQVVDWLELFPFPETRNYMQRSLEHLQIYRNIINKDNDFRLERDLLVK